MRTYGELTCKRTNEYFVSGEGIRWEVVEEDLVRYLGGDATVRRGVYEVSSVVLTRFLFLRRKVMGEKLASLTLLGP